MLQLIGRVWSRGLVHAVLLAQECFYPQFVAQTTLFGMAEVCSGKGEGGT